MKELEQPATTMKNGSKSAPTKSKQSSTESLSDKDSSGRLNITEIDTILERGIVLDLGMVPEYLAPREREDLEP